MITIPKANDYLEVDFLKYANAILIQEDYVNKFRAVSTFDFPNESGLELIEQEENKPIFNPKRHTEYSPKLSETEINSLKDPDLFTKEELVEILNTVILKYINWKELSNERSDGHCDDITTVPNTQL